MSLHETKLNANMWGPMIEVMTKIPQRPSPNVLTWIGILIGIVMPVLSAVIYPTYMNQMQPEWAEWTRLMELPFIACEILIIHVASQQGYRETWLLTKLPVDIVFALIMLVVGITVSSVLFSANPFASITYSITTIIHLRLCAAVFYMASSEKNPNIPVLFLILAAGLFTLTIITIIKFKFPPPEWTVPGGKYKWESALPGFISVRHFGSWTGAIAAAFMANLLFDEEKNAKLTSTCYLLASGLTCWSGTRAAVAAMGLVALILVISLRRLPRFSSILRVGALSALALVGSIIFSPGLPDFMLFMTQDMQSADSITSGRLKLWHDTGLRWLDAPFFGWGSGSTFWELNWVATQPHNAILQFLISWGAVGAFGALWLLGRALVAVHRIGMHDETHRPLTAALYSLLLMSLVEGMLFYPRFIMLIMIAFGVLFAARERIQK